MPEIENFPGGVQDGSAVLTAKAIGLSVKYVCSNVPVTRTSQCSIFLLFFGTSTRSSVLISLPVGLYLDSVSLPLVMMPHLN